MKIEIAKYYNNAKSAFSFVFDDGCYKESTLDAYENLKEERPINKTRKLVSKNKVKNTEMEKFNTSQVIETQTPKKLVKPKTKLGVKKLSME